MALAPKLQPNLDPTDQCYQPEIYLSAGLALPAGRPTDSATSCLALTPSAPSIPCPGGGGGTMQASSKV